MSVVPSFNIVAVPSLSLSRNIQLKLRVREQVQACKECDALSFYDLYFFSKSQAYQDCTGMEQAQALWGLALGQSQRVQGLVSEGWALE